MDSSTKVWIKSMELFYKYWGCHQMPERSFFIKGYQLPICARCTGIIIGEFISFILFMLNFRLSIMVCIVYLLPLILDGTIQYLVKYVSNNRRRLITGLIFGLGFMQLICSAIYKLHSIIFS